MSRDPNNGTHTHADWGDALREGRILGQRCADCDHCVATPKSVFANCASRTLEAVELPTSGTVYTETTIEVTPIEHDNRYQIAVVDLGMTRILGRIDGHVEIGDEVALRDHVDVEDFPGPVFEPVD